MEIINSLLLAISLCVLLWGVAGQYEWQLRDAVDEIREKIDKVTADNCYITHFDDLYLPENSVSHHPDVKEININPVFPNRTAMLHLHNMAMNRAFFWSYILQSRFIRPAINDTYDPGMMYYFLSSVADVAANPYINASSIYFSPNTSYTSSYRGFFNKTLPRFAPRAFRADDFNDPVHLQKISTLNTFHVLDLGAFEPDSLSKDYSSDYYRTNEWYFKWLPDKVDKRHDTKTTYQVEIRYANNTNETFTFHGPPGNDEVQGPVNWTRPYFDCGRLNKWLVGAVSPVADIYPRHTQFRHIEFPTYTAAVVMEMDFDRIDINQCNVSLGNDRPNRFAGTARCKLETTECEPLHGWGFRRGGYQCRCRPGYRLPSIVRRPYLGEIIERATSDQYYNNFDCKEIGWVQKLPVKWEKAHPLLRALYADRYYEYVNASAGAAALHAERLNIFEVLNFIRGVQPHNCSKYKATDLFLNGDIAFGAPEQFENQAKMAVRLANFISAFLQVSDPYEVFSGTRVADRPLTEDQMIGETLAIILGDSKIWSAGTYWDRNKFTNRTYFAPFAYKTELNTRKYKLEDLARLNKTEDVYTNKQWFQFLKQRWSTNFDNLEKFFLKMKLRDDELGVHLRQYEKYPTFYRAANIKHGHWTQPYYDCEGPLKQWVVTYASPFFGWDNVKVKLEFKGVVAVTMSLMSLDINQCPDKYYVPNAFKGTDKCDRKSSYCVPILGRGFEAGGYKCECLQGYEYPFEDLTTYYDGQIVEAEFQNIILDKETRIDMFTCRLAGAAAVQSSLVIIIAVVALVLELR
ncbi:PREDICTED: uncharacterized protein LOC106106296 [Papilio polytes]|uniref:uncharacterized protein LOC106106296 n=1 Tax=Papilio polytes TaxID=76194 RepID=UPI0006764205|nr:PREDICTED: uncharacterized protein LOC106106296 [Papilio polytes]